MSEIVRQNIEIMNSLDGFDIVIVCCSSLPQANYWEGRLKQARGSIVPENALVLAVEEDWPGGAGNGLGTLYAYHKAVQIAKNTIGRDISAELAAGSVSIGLFHTAGKGTRLAPLPGAENNNKPGVKLPATVKLGETHAPITILEAVIKQTGSYASSRKGRLSVFWGDQIFIPTVPIAYNVTHHVDILCSLGPMPTEADWKAKGLDKYGLIARNSQGNAAQVEKVDHATAVKLLADLGAIEAVGASLGSFSVSNQFLFAMLNEYSQELSRKSGKYDTDPHFWMPLTLSKSSYLHLMKQKGVSEEESGAHHDRMAGFLTKFYSDDANKKYQLFGPVDVGQGVYWWDYGQLKLYQNNTLLLTQNSVDAELLKLFFGLKQNVQDSQTTGTDIDSNSVVSSSSVSGGFVRGSIVNNVRAKHIEADGAILVNVTAERIIAKPGSIVYNVIDTAGSEGLVVESGQVLAGVFSDDGSLLVMKSLTSIDGGKAWEIKVEGNPYTFDEINKKNHTADPAVLEKVSNEQHEKAWKSITQA